MSPSASLSVPALLEALGATEGAVAATLRAGSHRGSREPHCCPVARYLAAAGVPEPWVGPGALRIAGATRIPLPRPVRLFVRAFDFGEYSDLLADGEGA